MGPGGRKSPVGSRVKHRSWSIFVNTQPDGHVSRFVHIMLCSKCSKICVGHVFGQYNTVIPYVIRYDILFLCMNMMYSFHYYEHDLASWGHGPLAP